MHGRQLGTSKLIGIVLPMLVMLLVDSCSDQILPVIKSIPVRVSTRESYPEISRQFNRYVERHMQVRASSGYCSGGLAGGTRFINGILLVALVVGVQMLSSACRSDDSGT
ncbi:hypothetical protein F4823DRAFT_69623 [Ustulina deusta]|nr:hypothetical protein F4823DRAFT_69623 [Ustulina deusta]